MTMTWDDIPDREQLPPDFEGFGLSDELKDSQKVAPADMLGETFAVTGFLFLRSSFDEDDAAPVEGQEVQQNYYAKVQILTPQGKTYYFNSSAGALMKTLKNRWEREEIPFKTKLVKRRSKKGREYYVFEDV